MTDKQDGMADDMLRGAGAIAAFMGLDRRQVYHLIHTKALPTARMGQIITARKSSLSAWISRQEQESVDRASPAPGAKPRAIKVESEDREIANAIRNAVDSLNSALAAAKDAGLLVSISPIDIDSLTIARPL